MGWMGMWVCHNVTLGNLSHSEQFVPSLGGTARAMSPLGFDEIQTQAC